MPPRRHDDDAGADRSAPSASLRARKKALRRADKNEDGRITLPSCSSRAAAFAKLDPIRRHTAFEEWAVKTIDKFTGRCRPVALTPSNMPPPRPSRGRKPAYAASSAPVAISVVSQPFASAARARSV